MFKIAKVQPPYINSSGFFQSVIPTLQIRREHEDQILCTKDGVKFVVSNQWGSYNSPHILELLDKWVWNVIKDK